MVNNALKHINKPSRRNEQTELDQYLDTGYDADILSTLAVEEIIKVVNQLPEGYKTVFNLNVSQEGFEE